MSKERLCTKCTYNNNGWCNKRKTNKGLRDLTDCEYRKTDSLVKLKSYYEQKKWEYEVNKLIYFLKEDNDETCSHQNNIDYNMNIDFVKTEDDTPYVRMETSFPTKEDEQKWEEHKKRDNEIFEYRKESFEKALKQFNAIARDLWD